MNAIYIPIWLDLLWPAYNSEFIEVKDLHSNMVRFIIIRIFPYPSQISSIYIPIWLDLLFELITCELAPEPDLHSNMVRFIIS